MSHSFCPYTLTITERMTVSELPPNATPLSRQHAQMMAEFVQGCPKKLGREIYLYCSVAKGYADRFSDIEVTFLVDEVQEPTVYEAWLRAGGATVDPVTMAWGGGYTTKSWLGGVFIEAAWRPVDALDSIINDVSRAETTDHWKLVDAWHIRYALPLTGAPQLGGWQRALSVYPEALQTALVGDAVRFLGEPHYYPLSLVNAFKLAERDVPMLLSGELTWTVERALRILFAINRQWEPDYKWLKYEAERLERKPDRLVERVNEAFTLLDLRERVKSCFGLLLDVLELVPIHIDVAAEKAHVAEAMEPERWLRTF